MNKDKRSRIVAILALFVSIVGLTLGFAAFSNTLTISSSATVSPDSSDFNINAYGIENWTTDYPTYDMFTSNSISKPRLEGSKSATTAKISDNGKAITISDLSVEMVEPNNDVIYSFLIKNEGEYTAYLDTTLFDEMYSSGVGGQCTPGKDATKELVDGACDYISMTSWLEGSDGATISSTGDYELAKGDYIVLTIVIGYSDVDGVVRADGDFSVAFDDMNLSFTSVPAGE